MSGEMVQGSCLCRSVTFEVQGPPSAFRYCHCSRCRKASGSAHASNLFVPAKQFRWLAGKELVNHYKVPEARTFAVSFCTHCGTRVPHEITERNEFLVPAGALDGDPGSRPQHNIFWNSKAPWFVETPDLPKFPERP
jgi:hypothetical protein